MLVDRLAAGDRQKPGPRARTVESGIGAQGRDQRLLQDVIDVVGRKHPAQERRDRARVVFDQALEGCCGSRCVHHLSILPTRGAAVS